MWVHRTVTLYDLVSNGAHMAVAALACVGRQQHFPADDNYFSRLVQSCQDRQALWFWGRFAGV